MTMLALASDCRNSVIENSVDLVEGWYAIGFKDFEGEIDWGSCAIYEYLGEGQWANDYGEPVETTWDRYLQLDAGLNEADAYMPQF